VSDDKVNILYVPSLPYCGTLLHVASLAIFLEFYWFDYLDSFVEYISFVFTSLMYYSLILNTLTEYVAVIYSSMQIVCKVVRI
jgi:hypothetical protein